MKDNDAQKKACKWIDVRGDEICKCSPAFVHLQSRMTYCGNHADLLTEAFGLAFEALPPTANEQNEKAEPQTPLSQSVESGAKAG